MADDRHDPNAPDPSEHVPEEELVPEDDTVIGRAFRWSLLGIAVVILIVVALFVMNRRTPDEVETVERNPVEAPPPLNQPAGEATEAVFRDVTAVAGIDFVHVNGATGEKLLPETMGGGVAFFDYDNDGDQDLLLVNSDRWPTDTGPRGTMGLYRNDGTGRFKNVTKGSGLGLSFYGQGVATGDADGDGLTDIFLTAVGPNHLFLNKGNGTFEETTQGAGVAGEGNRWSTSAGFFDYDNDGDLDLFVCNYVEWSREIDMQLNFTLNGTDRAYGPPKQYRGTYSYLYRNEGGGRFTDVSAQSGIQVDNPVTNQPMGKSLAVIFIDADRDGYLDIFVANDTVQNFLFQNQADGTFEELGAISGLGYDNAGMATGAMGIDGADFDNDGVLGVGIGNFANEPTSLYMQQDDPWQFVDMSAAEGVGSPSLLRLSFGLFFFDYDLDGRIDFLQANGHLEEEINQIQPSQHYRQPAQLFWNSGCAGRPCFAQVDDTRVGDLSAPIVGRGATYADIDADGDLDVALAQTGGPPVLLRNDLDTGNHWLRVRLVGRAPNREAIGARVELTTGDTKQTRLVMPTRSYLSQVELPVTFGLGQAAPPGTLHVVWPDGYEQDVPVSSFDRLVVVERED